MPTKQGLPFLLGLVCPPPTTTASPHTHASHAFSLSTHAQVTQGLVDFRLPLKLLGERHTCFGPGLPAPSNAAPPQAFTHMDNKARLREVQVQVYQGSKPKGPQQDITFDGEKIRCGGAVIKVSPSERRGREGGARVGDLDA